MKKILSIAFVMSFGALNMYADEIKKESFLTKLKKKAGEVKESAKKSVGKDEQSYIAKAKKLAGELKLAKGTKAEAIYSKLVKLKKEFKSSDMINQYEAIMRQARKDFEATEGSEEIAKKNAAKKEAAQQAEARAKDEAQKRERLQQQEQEVARRQAEFDAESVREFREKQARRQAELAAKFDREYQALKKEREDMYAQADERKQFVGGVNQFNWKVQNLMQDYTSPDQQRALKDLLIPF